MIIQLNLIYINLTNNKIESTSIYIQWLRTVKNILLSLYGTNAIINHGKCMLFITPLYLYIYYIYFACRLKYVMYIYIYTMLFYLPLLYSIQIIHKDMYYIIYKYVFIIIMYSI